MTVPEIRTNPNNPIPHEVTEGFQRIAEEEAAATARSVEFATLARPTLEERDLQLELAMIGKSPVADPNELHKRASLVKHDQLDRLQRGDMSVPASYVSRPPMDFEPSAPEPMDTQFWAADWTSSTTPPFVASSQADGIHFTGRKTSDSGSLQFLSYGVKSRYGISADRIPPSATGRWRSAPHIELFGRLLAYTGSYDIFTGDCWSKCWMIRRQTLTQFRFGPTGPVPTVIGEGIQVQPIFNEENRHVHVELPMPGFQFMPPVVLTQIFGGLTIWAELEVRFDIQLEGSSLHWIHPFDLLLRMFQWPLQPNA
jgi:hypothetical protein